MPALDVGVAPSLAMPLMHASTQQGGRAMPGNAPVVCQQTTGGSRQAQRCRSGRPSFNRGVRQAWRCPSGNPALYRGRAKPCNSHLVCQRSTGRSRDAGSCPDGGDRWRRGRSCRPTSCLATVIEGSHLSIPHHPKSVSTNIAGCQPLVPVYRGALSRGSASSPNIFFDHFISPRKNLSKLGLPQPGKGPATLLRLCRAAFYLVGEARIAKTVLTLVSTRSRCHLM